MALLIVSMAAAACPAQSPTTAAELNPAVALPGTWEFDVASIRPSRDVTRRQRLFRHPEETEFAAQNASLGALLQFAFGVSETRVIGVPKSLASARFDLQAKGDWETETRFHKLNPDEQRAAKQRMMQALLADRFKLGFHVEMREQAVFALVVAKGGPKLQPSDQKYASGWGGWTRIEIEGGDTLTRFAEELARVSGRPVLNRTGLTGSYDIEVEWAADDDDNADLPQLYTAIREQLGLSLEPHKAPVAVVVVDHLEMPSEN
jgi:uncharacterized protein (TIGR03435 family)